MKDNQTYCRKISQSGYKWAIFTHCHFASLNFALFIPCWFKEIHETNEICWIIHASGINLECHNYTSLYLNDIFLNADTTMTCWSAKCGLIFLTWIHVLYLVPILSLHAVLTLIIFPNSHVELRRNYFKFLRITFLFHRKSYLVWYGLICPNSHEKLTSWSSYGHCPESLVWPLGSHIWSLFASMHMTSWPKVKLCQVGVGSNIAQNISSSP